MSTFSVIVGSSDIGRVRDRNEDTLVLLPDLGVAGVADGMGGAPGGDVASRLAGRAVEDTLRERLSPAWSGEATAEALGSVLHTAITAAHRAVRTASEADAALTDMGTTLTVFVAPRGADAWALGHVGDSRAYRWRQGELVQLTRDHTWIQDLVDEGRLDARQARWHPYRHVLSQCIGSPETPRIQIENGQPCPGDLYLLCTDGMAGTVDEETLGALLRKHVRADADPEALHVAAERLVEAANQRGGEDNITVALALIGESPAVTRAPRGG